MKLCAAPNGQFRIVSDDDKWFLTGPMSRADADRMMVLFEIIAEGIAFANEVDKSTTKPRKSVTDLAFWANEAQDFMLELEMGELSGNTTEAPKLKTDGAIAEALVKALG